MNNQKRKDEHLNQRAQKIVFRIKKKILATRRGEIEMNSICFKLMCGCNKNLERKIKEYIVQDCGLELMKAVFEYCFLGGILKFKKKMYIIQY